MVREIKFRAWNGEKMLEPMTIAEFSRFAQEFGYIDFKDLTLLEYTGLKDKNGDEICESDIVNHFKTPDGHLIGDDEGNHFYRIVWSGSGLTLCGINSDIPVSFLLDKQWGECLEITGNIYEN